MDVDGLIGWNFKRLRLSLSLSQEEIALRLGTIDQGYISQIEHGERNLTGRTIYRLSAAMGVAAGEFFLTEGVPTDILNSTKTVVKRTRAGRKKKQPPKKKPSGLTE